MLTIPTDITKLTVEAKAQLYLALKCDKEVKQYLYDKMSDKVLTDEITRRDAAYESGILHLTSLDDLKIRLKNRRDYTTLNAAK